MFIRCMITVLFLCLATLTRAQDASGNLIRNPDFARPPRSTNELAESWNAPLGYLADGSLARRVKTGATGEWFASASPGAYVAMSQEVTLVPGRKYILTVHTRRRGEGSAIGLAQSGPPAHGSQIMWGYALTEDFRPITVTFRAMPWATTLQFYNVTSTPDQGSPVGRGSLDIARVELREAVEPPRGERR